LDNIDHGLLMKAVRHHTDCSWVLLYAERWLKAPMQREDGSTIARHKGTPQGGPLSPLLANLFLHYAFDRWMATHHSDVPFCRYADDGVIHCRTESHARHLQDQLARRLNECGLELHPEKTRVVYCKDQHRKLQRDTIQFDFLGYSFRPRRSNDRHGQAFTNFLPALSGAAAKAMRQAIRGWKLQLKSDKSIDELAFVFGPRIQGWIAYYCRFYRSAFWVIAHHLNRALVRWAMRKYKRFRGHKTRAWRWLANQAKRRRGLFPHWRAGFVPYAGPMGAR
jgi:RNA-directed DNA polymerase